MTVLSSRPARIAGAVLVQLALVPLVVAGPLSARLTGDEYRLEVAPLDPVDPFRGAYVALAYPGLPSSGSGDGPGWGGEVAYVPLTRQGDVWVGPRVVAERPESGPYLRCSDEGWRLQCGIDSWFLPQDRALALEQAVFEGSAVATVRIDSRGNAALVDVSVREDVR